MLGMKNKDIVMMGIIIGIIFFFVGAIIGNVFPSTESNLLSYKVAATIKLLGIGILITSMIIGGVILQHIENNLRLLLLLLGLILLIIYSIGSQALQWNIPSESSSFETEVYESRPTGYGIPGFELLPVIAAIGIVYLCKQKYCR